MPTIYKGIALLLLAGITITWLSSCKETLTVNRQAPPVTIKKWLNWNAVFNPETDSVQRQAFIAKMKTELAAVQSTNPQGREDSVKYPYTYYLYTLLRKRLGKDAIYSIVNVNEHYCSCNDPLLWNIDGDLQVDTASVPSVPTSPPPAPKTAVSGNPLDALAKNDKVKFNDISSVVLNPENQLEYNNGYKMSPDAVIAVIDTGIDTLMIDEILRKNLLWNGPGGSRNFILNANVNDYNDDHPVRHGTAVAAIAMNSFYDASNNTMLPKLMVLKALDNNGEGRLFEFCCALSYAVENHATVVNASLGYYGTDNSVLDHYAGKSNHDSIPIVAAAGNDTSARFKSYCFNGLNPQDLLINPERMFYPACLASNVKAYPVISVTGFRTPGVPCYYQNYSSEYITMGVFNDSLERSCCAYSLPFFRPGLTIEGSSFATPVVSGRLALQISRMGRRPNVPGYISLLSVLNPLPPLASLAVTQGNQYIRY